MAHSFDDLKWCLQADLDENAVRKLFTPDEAVHIGWTLKEIGVTDGRAGGVLRAGGSGERVALSKLGVCGGLRAGAVL